MTSEYRKQYFLNKYVLITPGRAKRPHEILEQSLEVSNFKCEFCPEAIEKSELIKTYGKEKPWSLAVLSNKFPAVELKNDKAYGVQEIIVETPIHEKQFSSLDIEHLTLYFEVLADRLKEISKDKKIEYVLEFKNHGSKAGASIKHEHSQIFATNILPPDILEELKLAQNYKIEHNACPYCDILKKELSGPRKIYEDRLAGAFAPFAPEYHYEAWIFTKRHVDNISQTTAGEKESLAQCLKLILEKLNSAGIDYNFFLHQVVSQKDQHFYIKVQPRDKNIWGGVELGSGLVINSVSPEKAAEFYQK
ncbi:MAG: DUF4931 domain-containing protein [Patescibacteria group bacterium]|jgi:UDPglucose--hexose-1-phosphate uridylyltransferase